MGIDLGTSAVKVMLVNQSGQVSAEASHDYALIQERAGYSEQDPELWVGQTLVAIKEVIDKSSVRTADIEGISFSGQMHGLVMLDKEHQVLRPAILWNDTRTTVQCRQIEEKLGQQLLSITKNPALEGFTLPKILWVKEHERHIYEQMKVFMLPKDYLCFRLTGHIGSEYSDAAGTLLLDLEAKQWSKEICQAFGLDPTICPPLAESSTCVGTVLASVANETGLTQRTKVFAGGADNACGATGAGILSPGSTLSSIGTSGVILSYEDQRDLDFQGKVHYFYHSKVDAFYTMGVTLAAGYSLQWFKERFAPDQSFDNLLQGVSQVEPGAGGLLFTPYLVGERTPHADANIRASFIGLDAAHGRKELARAVMEGITFSLNESIHIFRQAGKTIDDVISIGGGAKNRDWLQMQADVFDAKVTPLENEQGPGMGAAMIAAYGCGWFASLEQCAQQFTKKGQTVEPVPDRVRTYRQLFGLYQDVYVHTKALNEKLAGFRVS